ncbi:uncharacterized protein LOC121370257 [Gigantopelta aegis]|uniref:uncharacterized protein LOC121370257 n=1 Tax=Gigantopelta aegis TaxID=1735272 RepID=UPI001B8874EF|nr:uncharacterized protein LOC121370257 [Gigantopelta aegis]
MIRLLPQELRSRLRSGVTITHLTQCVEELVMNSLDAGANCIAVRIDLPCFKIQVVDNGTGISSEQLEMIGNRYFTSKCHEIQDLENLSYFGYRGEALASLKDTAVILDVTTRTRQSSQTYCKMFQRGTSLTVFDSTIHRPSAGTTVTIHDLFYNLPVRRKSMTESLELERIRHRMEGIALIHPNISFSLRNDVTGHVLLQTHKSSCMLTAFTYLFGPRKSKCLCPVSTSHGGFQVEGYMGKEPHYNKELQFIYINERMVLKTKIHKLINQILSKSLVYKRKSVTSEGENTVNSSPTKQNERYSIFVLNIKCPLDVYDITFDPAKTLVEFKDWMVLTASIESMVWSFLKKENLVSLADASCLVSSPDKTVVDTEKQSIETQESKINNDVQLELARNKNDESQTKTGDIDPTDNALTENKKQFVENIGDRISTHNMMQGLHSQMVTRITNSKDVQGNTEVTGEDSSDRSSELDIVNVDNSNQSKASVMSLVSAQQSDESTVSVTPHDGVRSPARNIAISDTESKDTDSPIAVAEASTDSCLRTPDRPTVHGCVSPKIAVVPSTNTCSVSKTEGRFQSSGNDQSHSCDSDMEIEDPLISPLKMLYKEKCVQSQHLNGSNAENERNLKPGLESTAQKGVLSYPGYSNRLEQTAVANSFKEKIQLSLGQLYSRRTATNMNKISRITLTPEKRKASRSFRLQISENLAAGGFMDPAFNKVCDPDDLPSVTRHIKYSIQGNPELVSETECRAHRGQSDSTEDGSAVCTHVAKNSEYTQKEDCDQNRISSLIQAENPLQFSIPSGSMVRQVDRNQDALKPYIRCQNTVTTQTSPDLQNSFLESSTRKKESGLGVRKRLHPTFGSLSTVASKLSKLVQANAHNKTKGNISDVMESSGSRHRFMTSASFCETPRTVFARLSAQTENVVSGPEPTVGTQNGRGIQNVHERLNINSYKQTGRPADHSGVCCTGNNRLPPKHFLQDSNSLTGKHHQDTHNVKFNSDKSEVSRYVIQSHEENLGDKSCDLSISKNVSNPCSLASFEDNGLIKKTDHILKPVPIDISSTNRHLIKDIHYDQDGVQNLVHLDSDCTRRQITENLPFVQDSTQKQVQLNDTGTSREMIKILPSVLNNSEKSASTKPMSELYDSTILQEASQGFDVPSRPVMNVGRSQRAVFHSQGFSLSEPELEAVEPELKETDLRCRYSYETQEFSPMKDTCDKDEHVLQKRTSLFSDIFTPVESGGDIMHKDTISASVNDTNDSQSDVLMTSEFCCGQQHGKNDSLENTDTSPLYSLLSKHSQSPPDHLDDEQFAARYNGPSPSLSVVHIFTDNSSVNLVDKNDDTTAKPHTHMISSCTDNSSVSINTSNDLMEIPHTQIDSSGICTDSSNVTLVNKNGDSTAKPQTQMDSFLICTDNSSVRLDMSDDFPAKPQTQMNSSVIGTHNYSITLDVNCDTTDKPHSQMDSSMNCTDSSNVTVVNVSDDCKANLCTQVNSSVICMDNSSVKLVKMSDDASSKSQPQINSSLACKYISNMNPALHLNTTNKESDIQTNSVIQKECNEISDTIPSTSSSEEIRSDNLEHRGSLQTMMNEAETDGDGMVELEQVLGNNRCVEDRPDNSLMKSADKDLCLKPSNLFNKDMSEMWSPDSLLDSAETVETGPADGDQVKASTSSSLSHAEPESPQSDREQTQDIWKKVEDPKTAGALYVNILTGNTMSEDEWHIFNAQDSNEQGASASGSLASIASLSPSEKLKLQAMLSSHLEASTEDRGVKWRSSSSWESADFAGISSLLSTWNNPVFEKPKQVAVNAEVHHDTFSAGRCFQSLYPTRFTKKMLQDVKVLGQIDNKFIACVLKTDDKNTSQVPNLIVLVDQHAAHERVRLEQLTEDLYVDDDVGDCSIKQSQLIPPKALCVTDEEIRLMKSFRAEINRIGITFTCSSTNRNQVNIHTVPACIVEREANELKRKRDSVAMEIVEVLLKDHIQLLKNTGGARSQLPQTLHKVLCSQACHGAVKFGDALTFDQCVQLIENLSTCSLPFQCAHGRPSVTPLIDLDHLKSKLTPERIRRPSLWKISRNLDIHK